MDNYVDAMNTAYQGFVYAVAAVCEAKSASDCEDTPATDAALENLKLKWKLYRVACDKAEAFVWSLKQRIRSECLADKASCSVVRNAGQTGVPPISAVRLEQMSREVRSLVAKLQSGAESVGSSSVGFDPRFHKDSAQ